MSEMISEKIYSMAEVCELIGIKYHRLYYAEYIGELPKVKRIGRNRFYTEQDVQVLKKYFANRGAK